MIVVVQFDSGKHQDAVVALWAEVFGYGAPHNDPVLAIRKKVAVADGLFFAAEDAGGMVVGTVMGGYDGHRGWIYSLAVTPGNRDVGIGRALMAEVEAALRERGCLKVNLQIVEQNAGVAEFYEKLGFEVEPRVSMGKRLE